MSACLWRVWSKQRRRAAVSYMAALAALVVGITGCAASSDQTAQTANIGGPEKPAQLAKAPASFTVAANGDILLHDILNEQARSDAGGRGYDYVPMLAAAKSRIGTADLGICHMETALAPRSGPFSGYPLFNSPPHITKALGKLGYDTCSTASNHSIDKGEAGVERTLNELDDAGIEHAGTARTEKESERVTMLDAGGVKVASLSYTYGLNGMSTPEGKSWLVNRIDGDKILADARKAREAGAEAVILSMHWGEEYSHDASQEQVSLAKKLLGSPDVDLIVGHHAHVVQPFEKINGKWVAYGLGNLVANPTANSDATHEGVLARFTFKRDGDGWDVSPEAVPTLVTGMPARLVDLPDAVEGSSANGSRYKGIIDKTMEIVRSRGADVPVAERPE